MFYNHICEQHLGNVMINMFSRVLNMWNRTEFWQWCTYSTSAFLPPKVIQAKNNATVVMIWASYVATDVIKLYLFQEILFFFFKETSTEHCTHANMLLLRCWSRMKLWNSGYSAAGPCQGSGGGAGGGAHLANRAWVILAGLDITCQQLDHYSLGEVAGGSSFSRRWCVVESLHDILAKARNKGEHHQHL